MKILLNVRNGNSADAKKLWFEHCSDINITADEGIKSFGIYSDAAMMANKFEESQRSCHGQTASKQHCINNPAGHIFMPETTVWLLKNFLLFYK